MAAVHDKEEQEKLNAPTRLGTTGVDPHDSEAHAIVYRYAVADGAKLLERQDVWTFFYPHTPVASSDPDQSNNIRSQEELHWLKMRRDLFLLAFQAIQQLPSHDRWSFYQIAGIHGLPHQPYDGVDTHVWTQSSTWSGGYCHHGSPLFPTWHRPYLLLLEQSIIRQAKLLVEGLSDEQEKEAAAEIANRIRLPYWDWAAHPTRTSGMPDIFMSSDISLAYPWKSFSASTIFPNPLRAFVLPEDVGSPHTSSDVGIPFTPKGYPTVRHPDSSSRTQDDNLDLTVLKGSNTDLVEGVYAMFHNRDWLPFSNHYCPDQDEDQHPTDCGHYSSLELVHDLVHLAVGGWGGHMAYTDLAAFDPIFFFHHANVDRLTALWQYCYPESWVSRKTPPPGDHYGTFTFKPGSDANATTDLTPFRLSTNDANKFAVSNDVRFIETQCGYTYPEIAQARREFWPPGRMLAHVLNLYKPPESFFWRWVLVVQRILKRAFNGPFRINVFLDMPDATFSTPTSSPHYAGSIYVFARANLESYPCANCEIRKFMQGTVDLTKTMVRLGITTAAELMGDPEDNVPMVNPLDRPESIKLVFLDLLGRKELDPSSVHQGAKGGGLKTSLYLQQCIRDEHIEDSLVRNVSLDLSSVKVLNKFTVNVLI